VGSTGSAGAVRVILVGPTGLEVAVRADPGLRVVGVKDGLEAVAELSRGEGPSVVVMGSDLDERVARAMRSVNPRVRVLSVTENGSKVPAGADGVVSRALPAAGVCARLREAACGERDESEPVARAGVVGDAPVVEAMLRGGDVLSAAMEVLRARTGDPSARFYARGDPAGEASGGVPVMIHGVELGRLACRGGSGDHAAWLAGWLRLRDQHEQLKEAAFTDCLTGAYNRRYFDLYMRSLLERARRERETVSLLLLDLDNFKAFNDHHGHEAGDEILRETVRLLRSVIRPGDRVCRIGGDEFVVIFHDTEGPRQAGSRPPHSVYQVARRFQEQVRRQRFPKLGSEFPGAPDRLEVSGGLAVYPWDGSTAEELLAHADRLLREGKRRGKNVIRFGPEGSSGGSD
jgi:diguanylate cyclase (GGDEF)-like protein